MTPPFCAKAFSWSSVRLRGWSQSALALPWEKITGFAVTSSASKKPPGLMWARSTSMPSRFISCTRSHAEVSQPDAVARLEAAVGRAAAHVVGQADDRTPSS